MSLCENCPRANDRYKKGVIELVEEARATEEPMRVQLADIAFSLIELGTCPGRRTENPAANSGEFADNGYTDCQHTTEAAAATILSHGLHALDRIKEISTTEEDVSSSKVARTLDSMDTLREFADRAKQKRSRGEGLSVDEGAMISLFDGDPASRAAARSHLFGD